MIRSALRRAMQLEPPPLQGGASWRTGTVDPFYEPDDEESAGEAARRTLGESDVRAFVEAAEIGDKREGPARYSGGANRSGFIRMLSFKYPGRMRRLGKDLDWLRRQAKKEGLTDEDVRCLL